MLKIKSDIDLKELERFGFKLNDKGQYSKRYTLIYKNRKISGRSGDKGHSKLYIAYELYDLIQARISRESRGGSMNADKMFEKLGYRLEHNHYNSDNSDIYTYHEKGRNNFLRFNTATKTFYSLFDKIYNVDELQAINAKCKELGWIE